MNTLELFQSYPKAAKVIKEWFITQMLSTIDDEKVPEDFKQIVREMGLNDDVIADMLTSPRSLYSVFDSNGLFISILVNSEGEFAYKLIPRDVDLDDVTWYSSREEAEEAAVKDAIILLNDNL